MVTDFVLLLVVPSSRFCTAIAVAVAELPLRFEDALEIDQLVPGDVVL